MEILKVEDLLKKYDNLFTCRCNGWREDIAFLICEMQKEKIGGKEFTYFYVVAKCQNGGIDELPIVSNILTGSRFTEDELRLVVPFKISHLEILTNLKLISDRVYQNYTIKTIEK